MQIEMDAELSAEFDLFPASVRHYQVHGVAVRHYRPARLLGRPPVMLVHGGNHAAWVWDGHAAFLAGCGYEVHALDWYCHGDSTQLAEDTYLNRGIASVAGVELAHVADRIGVDPIVVGHSMGGLAAAVFASRRHVAGLAMLAPAPPPQAKPDVVPVEIDFDAPFPVPPFEVARQMFFSTMDDADARHWYALLEPESPRAVFEASRGTCWLHHSRITAPVLLVAAGQDVLFPVETQKRFAELLDAELVVVEGVGHSDLVLRRERWREGARALGSWLASL